MDENDRRAINENLICRLALFATRVLRKFFPNRVPFGKEVMDYVNQAIEEWLSGRRTINTNIDIFGNVCLFIYSDIRNDVSRKENRVAANISLVQPQFTQNLELKIIEEQRISEASSCLNKKDPILFEIAMRDAQGDTNDEIASQLEMSPRDVTVARQKYRRYIKKGDGI